MPVLNPPELPDFAGIIARIQAGDDTSDGATAELWEFIRRRIPRVVWRMCQYQHLDDLITDTFLAVWELTKRPDYIQQPERLVGIIDTIARRKCLRHLKQMYADKQYLTPNPAALTAVASLFKYDNPEQVYAETEINDAMQAALGLLKPSEYHLLTRCFILGETPAKTCAELNLTPTQYRLNKSRLKAKFGRICRQILHPENSPKTDPKTGPKNVPKTAFRPRVKSTTAGA